MASRSVLRPLAASGISAPNSAEVEAIRRFVQQRLPHGVQGAIALETGKTRARVAEEIEGIKPLSLDVATLAITALPLEDRARVWAHLLEPQGLTPQIAAVDPI